MASAIRFSLQGRIDSNGAETLTVDPRSLPGSAQIWNAYIDVVGQLAIIQCKVGQSVVAQANGTSPALGPVYTLPYEQVTFEIVGATPNTDVTVTLTGYYAYDVDDLPPIAAPPQNLQGPIVGSAVTTHFSMTNMTGGVGVFSSPIPLAGYGGFQLWVQTPAAIPVGEDIQFAVQFYDLTGNFIVQKLYFLDEHIHTIIDTIPMVGDHVIILANPTVNIATINYLITPFQQIPSHNWLNDDGIFITQVGSIAAGGAQEIFAGYVTTGPATMTLYTSSVTYNAQLRYWNGSGNIFWQSVNANISNAVNAQVNIPAYPVSMRIVNNGAGAISPVAILQLTK
jgi:hypothetical protein